MSIQIHPERPNDFYTAVAKGDIPGHSMVHKFGRNTLIDTATDPEDVWDGGGIWVAPTAARTHDIASGNGADAAAGLGAQTIRVEGLDSAGVLQGEDITMNGVTNVPTASTYTMIHRMYVLTVGATGTNVGVITATAQTDATVTAQISIGGFNQTLMAIYRIPSDKTGYLMCFWGSVNGGNAGGADVNLVLEADNSADGLYRVQFTTGLNSDGTSHFEHVYRAPVKYDASQTLKMNVEQVSANNADVSAGFDILLVDN